MSWPTVRLDECSQIVGGATPSTTVAGYWDGDVKWATPKDLSDLDCIYISDTPRKITQRGLASCAAEVLPANSVLFSSRAPIGHVAINTAPMATNQGFKSLIPNPSRLTAGYLYWWLKANRPYLESLGNGATFKEVSKSVVSRVEIPLPPLVEQRRIAAILDQADTLRRKRREALEHLDALPHALFIALFGDPSRNPKALKRCLLGDIIDFVGGSQPPKSTFLYDEGPDRVRFVQIRDFRTDEYKTYVPKHLAKRPFTEEDVMIGRYGPPVFQIFRGLSGTYNVALMKALPTSGVNKDFIYYLLQERGLHSFVVANSERTAGQSGVNLQLLENYPAYIPPKELLGKFSNQVAAFDVQRQAHRAQLKQLDDLFASLQHRAFRGEL